MATLEEDAYFQELEKALANTAPNFSTNQDLLDYVTLEHGCIPSSDVSSPEQVASPEVILGTPDVSSPDSDFDVFMDVPNGSVVSLFPLKDEVSVPPVQSSLKNSSSSQPSRPRKRQASELEAQTITQAEFRQLSGTRADSLAHLPAEEQKRLKKQQRSVFPTLVALTTFRMIKNRESAQVSRLRRKLYMEELERQVEELSNGTKALKEQVQKLQTENSELKDENLALDNEIRYLRKYIDERIESKNRSLTSAKAAGVCLLMVLFSFGLFMQPQNPALDLVSRFGCITTVLRTHLCRGTSRTLQSFSLPHAQEVKYLPDTHQQPSFLNPQAEKANSDPGKMDVSKETALIPVPERGNSELTKYVSKSLESNAFKRRPQRSYLAEAEQPRRKKSHKIHISGGSGDVRQHSVVKKHTPDHGAHPNSSEPVNILCADVKEILTSEDGGIQNYLLADDKPASPPIISFYVPSASLGLSDGFSGGENSLLEITCRLLHVAVHSPLQLENSSSAY